MISGFGKAAPGPDIKKNLCLFEVGRGNDFYEIGSYRATCTMAVLTNHKMGKTFRPLAKLNTNDIKNLAT